MASRRRITKAKRRNKKVKLILRQMREDGQKVNRKMKINLRCKN